MSLAAASATPHDRLLTVRGLSVAYGNGPARVEALRRIDLDLFAGEAVGVLGESGSGKSSLCLALLGILPPGGRVTAGAARLGGVDLLGSPEATLRRLRGDDIAMVAQEPGLALSPFLRVGDQIADVVRAHRPVASRRRLEREVLEMLAAVRLPDPERVRRAYPHQLSGGERQRAVIAQALVCRPRVLLADEPTASLDSIVQAELVDLLRRLQRERGLALLFVGHDPALLGELCDRLLVIYGGRIVESGSRDDLLLRPRHPYTRSLLGSIAAAGRRGEPLAEVPGEPLAAGAPAPGCPFEPRCAERLPRCRDAMPGPTAVATGHRVACVLYDEDDAA